MARFRRFSRRFISKPKRNTENYPCRFSNIIIGTQQVAYTWTAAEACTVKSIRLDAGATAITATPDTNVAYVLVRVPEGYNANNITYPALAADMYNPTELVLISGVLTDGSAEDHKSNFIGRKMKAGDRLALIFYNAGGAAVTVSFEINFSVLT